jgi:hypothetical protein
MPSQQTSIRILVLALLTSVFVHLAFADEGHTHIVAPPPADCAAAISRAADLTTALDKALSGAKPDPQAADNAFELATLAKSLGRLALADTSVPPDKVKPINLAGKSIADAADALHDALDNNKPDAARAALATLKPLIANLSAALPPDPYICEMRCEGKKSYDHPGKCPICKMDLIHQSAAPFAVQITASSPSDAIVAGKPISLDIRLLDQAGDPVGGIDVVHEHTLHLIIVSEDLSFYAHEHPTRTPDGVFHLAGFTFPFGSRFVAFADFTPTAVPGKEPINRIARTEFTVPQGDTATHKPFVLKENEDDVIHDGPYELRIRCNAGKFFARQDSYLRYGVDLNNKSVTDLEPLMGAMGHLVIISADTKKYIHAHPLTGTLPAAATLYSNGQPSDVTFHTIFPEPGFYRAFAQFQHKGRIILSAVTIDAKVSAAGLPSAAPTMPAHEHNHTH